MGWPLDDTTSSQPQPQERRPRFWVGPLVAGCCFALGYGVTQRVVTLQSNAEEPAPEAFAPAFFPGQSLDGLRARDGGTAADLQVDLIKLEAETKPEREAEEAAKKKAEEMCKKAKQNLKIYQQDRNTFMRYATQYCPDAPALFNTKNSNFVQVNQ